MIHHSALSFRKLRSMKIRDRRSCKMMILDAELATPETLSSPDLFAQFGLISSIRVLKDTAPREAHIRFESEDSAAAAIAWCNNESPLFTNAKYGYQKYCAKFINHQKCDLDGCPMRHSWSDTRDILNFSSLTPRDIAPPPSKKSPPPPSVAASTASAMKALIEEKSQMMAKIAGLQKQSYDQSMMLQRMWNQLQSERRANAALKMESSRMAAAIEAVRAASMALPAPPDTTSFSAARPVPVRVPVPSAVISMDRVDANYSGATTPSQDSWDQSVYEIVDKVISEGHAHGVSHGGAPCHAPTVCGGPSRHRNGNAVRYGAGATVYGSNALHSSHFKLSR